MSLSSSVWRVARLLVLLCAGILVLAGPVRAQVPDFSEPLPPIDGKRVALVIGNSEYRQAAGWAALPNAANDAAMVADRLKDEARGDARFDVEFVSNGTFAELQAALKRFAEKARNADIAVVYYGGHGFEFNLDNYIVPVDAPDIVAQESVAENFINMSVVVDAAKSKGFSIFFLDACRTEGPVIRLDDNTSGNRAALFGAVDAPQSVVFYATAMGDPAYDAAPVGSELSPFAAAVAAGVSAEGLDIPYVFTRVRDHVGRATDGFQPPQVPQFAGSWSRPFYFLPVGAMNQVEQAQSSNPTASRSNRTRARARVLPPKPLDIPLETLSTVDEPILVSRTLEQRSPANLIASAEAGDPIALYMVGYMYELGVAVPRDIERARQWLEKAAATGHPAGELEYGYFLLKHGEREDWPRAEALMRSASGKGYAKAKSFLAAELGWGTRLPQQPEESRQLLREAAELGHAYARFALAIRREDADAQIAALQDLSKQGNLEGDNWLCELGDQGFTPLNLFDHCLAAARAGYPSARALLARLYERGEMVAQSPSVARYWARLALGSADLESRFRNEMEALLAPPSAP